ncbi:BrnT family toxin [Thermodesulfobacteriota bacterium]
MIYWDDEKNKKLIAERGISFDEISEIILREEYLDILENPNREGQMIFIVFMNNYIYVVPFKLDEEENIILKTAYPSRKFYKIYGGQL